MYLPAAFRVDDADEFAAARAMTVEAAFGHLVAQARRGSEPADANDADANEADQTAVALDVPSFESTPLPFLVRDRPPDDGAAGTLSWSIVGHVARANPIVRCAGPALLIVPGPDTYISPSWYPSKAVDGKVVPTWNYEVVHLHGRLVIHDSAEWLRGMVDELTQRHEAPMPKPWSVDDAPDDYLAQMLRGIAGVELIVERVEAKRKLSQNRPETDRDGVLNALATSAQRGAHAVRSAMIGDVSP